jgi:hypothetical protein
MRRTPTSAAAAATPAGSTTSGGGAASLKAGSGRRSPSRPGTRARWRPRWASLQPPPRPRPLQEAAVIMGGTDTRAANLSLHLEAGPGTTPRRCSGGGLAAAGAPTASTPPTPRSAARTATPATSSPPSTGSASPAASLSASPGAPGPRAAAPRWAPGRLEPPHAAPGVRRHSGSLPPLRQAFVRRPTRAPPALPQAPLFGRCGGTSSPAGADALDPSICCPLGTDCRRVEDYYWACQYPDVPVQKKPDPKWPETCTGSKVGSSSRSMAAAQLRSAQPCCRPAAQPRAAAPESLAAPPCATLAPAAGPCAPARRLQVDWWMQCGSTTSAARADAQEPGSCCPINAKCASKSSSFWWCSPLDYLEEVIKEEAPQPATYVPTASPAARPVVAGSPPQRGQPGQPGQPLSLPPSPEGVPAPPGNPPRAPRPPRVPSTPRSPSPPSPPSPPQRPYTAPWPSLPPLPMNPPSPPARPWNLPATPPAPVKPPAVVQLQTDVRLNVSCSLIDVPLLTVQMTATLYQRLGGAGAIITSTSYCKDLSSATTAAVGAATQGGRRLLQQTEPQPANSSSLFDCNITIPSEVATASAARSLVSSVARQAAAMADAAVDIYNQLSSGPPMTATVAATLVTLVCQVSARCLPWALPAAATAPPLLRRTAG